MIIIENINSYPVGSLLKLKYGAFKKYPGNKLLTTHHMFVVVDENNVCVVSSNNSKVNDKYPYNVEIIDWKDAGLNKPSHVKTDVYGEINDKDIFDLVGHLTNNDLEIVLSIYNKSPQYTKLEWINI